MNYHSARTPKGIISLILVGIALLALFLGCKEEPRPKCLDIGDNPKVYSNPEKCIPKEF